MRQGLFEFEQLDASNKEFDEFEKMGMKNEVKPTKVTLKKKLPSKEADKKESEISLAHKGSTQANGNESNWVNDDDLDNF